MKLPDVSRDDLLRLAQYAAEQPGTTLLWSGGQLDSAQASYLFLQPTQQVQRSCWKALQAAIEPLEPDALWAGYLGYEMGATADRDYTVQRFPAVTPDSLFYQYGAGIRWAGQAEIIGEDDESFRAFTHSHLWGELPPLRRLAATSLQAIPMISAEAYAAKIRAIHEQIRAGEIYQMCLSHQFWLEGKVDPFGLFLALNEANPAPFTAFLNCGDFCVISSSPERFLQREGHRLETRPIKGTAPRSRAVAEDRWLRQQLLQSEKERAELLMITDLMRNDLGRVSEVGTVSADEVWRLEAYTNVYHLLSVVRSRLKAGLSSLEIVRQLFPAGSISGCPKLRAMEVIAQMEQRARGVYSGGIGYFWGPDRFDFNVAIRTFVVFPDRVQVQLGGGIVIDSDPYQEYAETLHKGKTLFNLLGLDVCLV